MSKEKYLIALDLDGTLLTDDKRITPKTRDYLNSLGAAGHTIVIATGRPLRAAYSYQQELGIKAPLVTYNGALTSDPSNPHFPKRTRTFDRNVLRQMVEKIGYEHLGNLMIETEHYVYLLRHDEALNTFFWNDRGTIVYGDPFLELKEDPLTLIFLFHQFDPESKRKITAIVESFPGLHIRFWNLEGYAELWQGASTKKEGIEYVADYYNIPRSNVIAFGDAENDKEMLAWAKYGVWMNNGVPSVKEYAKMKTVKDNNNDGIIGVLKKLIK